jgi:hypothetical protein
MSSSTVSKRLVTASILLVVTSTAAVGCAAATVASGPSATPTWGWSMLSSSDGQHVPIQAEGGAEVQDGVLVLDGATGFGSADSPAEFDPTQSFTVAAWVSTDQDTDPFASAVSEIGETAAAFYLGMADGLPAFSMKDADTNEEGHTTRAEATKPLPTDKWVHLAGVYDADQGELRLYVDGALAGHTPFSTPFHPAGPLTVGRSQAHEGPADFWGGTITEVHIMPTIAAPDQVKAMLTKSHPEGSPPVAKSADPATYADGRLNGTWDYRLTPKEIATVEAGFTAAEREEAGDVTALRLGFSGSRWWQGFVAGDKVWLVHGVPEGDGGVFHTEGQTLTTDNGSAVVTYDWSLQGDVLSFALTDCRLAGTTCDDIDIVRFMFARPWTFRSSDPSFD